MSFKRQFALVCVLLASASYLGPHSRAFSQESATGSSPDNSLVKELDELRAKVRRLEATLERNSGPGASTAEQAASTSASDAPTKMAGNGQMGKDKAQMGKTKGMMGRGPKMGSMSVQSALPGFPGASHIYHIGETGFFLDHPEHITLTAGQQKKLNDIKAKTLLADGTFERQIDETEQELWMLTAADEPDIEKIEAKVREIAKLNGDRRLAYIRAIGEAAAVLTDDQRQKLLGALASEGDRPDSTNPNA
ncbi:MAG: hypothetical protein BMS9Abin37_0160 [Acidobacteriota bacterium]|nr:MAG: hypothetical protein BMS9Abin37_0160 [Acidobacteriota bacterium]